MKPAFGILAAVFCIAFVCLGTWQLKRRVWKLDLIARVEQRVHAAAVDAPGQAAWPQVTAASDEYRHVRVSGRFMDRSQTLVQAVTALGPGYWVLTPFLEADGTTVLVNRGYVGADDRQHVRPGGSEQTTVSGLLRITEPGGGFLRHNVPAAAPAVASGGTAGAMPAAAPGAAPVDAPGGAGVGGSAGERWYSRDVQAIARARGLSATAPYFIDADDNSATGPATGSGVAPVGGLTVVSFHNSHLVYAITWYTLALLAAAGIWLGIRSEARP